MSTIQTSKCPNCGGSVEFDANAQKMVCPYCDAEFEIQQLNEHDQSEENKLEDKMEWDVYTSDAGDGWTQDESENMSAYVCNSCGAEIIADKQTGATFCPYCENPVILPVQFSGMNKPDYVIPFKIDKEGAKSSLTKFLKGKILLPKEFKDENRLEKVTGMYVPYWLFNCDARADIRYRATNVRRWSDSTYRYTKTSHYSLVRGGNVGFEKIPVDGSSKIDNKYTEAIEPFDYGQAVDFQTAYLTGYLADRYDVKAEECIPRVNERIKVSTEKSFRETTRGYTTVTPVSTNINISQGKIKYAMLPVWILNSKYKDKMYKFAMNGQTGHFVGELPIDWKKFWIVFGGVFAACSAITIPLLLKFLGG